MMDEQNDADDDMFSHDQLVTSVISSTGALHVSLNGREEVVTIFHDFFNQMYKEVSTSQIFRPCLNRGRYRLY